MILYLLWNKEMQIGFSCLPDVWLAWTFSTTVKWYSISLCFKVSLSIGAMQGFNAANFQRVTISSHRDAHAFWDACELELTLCLPGFFWWRATLVLNHQTMIWAVSRHCWVTISNNGMELRSLRLYISRTMERRFHMPEKCLVKSQVLKSGYYLNQ